MKKMDIGENIKKIRLSKKLTIKEVSDKANITKSLLSQIENNKANPSLKTLYALADTLKTPIGKFFDQEETDASPVVKASERRILETNNGVKFHSLTPQYSNHSLEFLYNVFSKDSTTGEYYSHAGEECGYVLKGKLKVEWDSKEFILEEGDSIILDSTKPHKITNIDDGESIAIWVDTPASW